MSESRPEYEQLDASDLFVGVVAARFNNEYVNALLREVLSTLKKSRCPERNCEVIRVPGANELPYVANMLAVSGEYDVVIALGCVIAGETQHDKVIAQSTAHAFHEIAAVTQVPVVNGIVTVENDEQARQRCTGTNARGPEFAQTAIEMAWMKLRLVERLEELDAEDEARLEEQDKDDPFSGGPFKNN